MDAKITAIAPWFGSKRTMAPEIVRQLGSHSYYFEACAGSMAVLFAKPLSEHETVCDLHGGLTNLAWIVQKEKFAVPLFNRLQRMLYSEELYAESKEWLGMNERVSETLDPEDWAYHYFIASWMGRNGVSGTVRVNYQLAAARDRFAFATPWIRFPPGASVCATCRYFAAHASTCCPRSTMRRAWRSMRTRHI